MYYHERMSGRVETGNAWRGRGRKEVLGGTAFSHRAHFHSDSPLQTLAQILIRPTPTAHPSRTVKKCKYW
jgi:hypothetical protein